MREPSSPFANGSREAVGERTLCLHPRSSLCQAFCGASPQGGIRQLRLGNSSRGEYRSPDRLVRGDPYGPTSADTSLGARTPAMLTPGNISSPTCLRSFKTHCAERGRTTPSPHPPSAPRASFVLKVLLLSVPVPGLGLWAETSETLGRGGAKVAMGGRLSMSRATRAERGSRVGRDRNLLRKLAIRRKKPRRWA